MSIRSICWG